MSKHSRIKKPVSVRVPGLLYHVILCPSPRKQAIANCSVVLGDHSGDGTGSNLKRDFELHVGELTTPSRNSRRGRDVIRDTSSKLAAARRNSAPFCYALRGVKTVVNTWHCLKIFDPLSTVFGKFCWVVPSWPASYHQLDTSSTRAIVTSRVQLQSPQLPGPLRKWWIVHQRIIYCILFI